MADRYWVGGTGTWDGTSTANWSASSGGASGASVPTAADNVFFDAGSDAGGIFTVTMATTPRLCNDFTASGLDFTMTLAGTSIGLTVSGSLEFPATNFTRTYTGTTTFNATTTGKTITTNGVAFGAAVTLNGVGGEWTLGSAFSCGTNTLTLTNGTFDTSVSNYAVTASTFSSSNSNTRTINLNASTITLSAGAGAWNIGTSTNATLNAGTSTITLSSNGPGFSGGGLTYYNVSFTGTPSTALIKTIDGTNTFNNLTFSTTVGAGLNNITIGANQTINGTLTINGRNGNERQFVRSNTLGTSRTLTCAAIASTTDVDFRDITIAGAHGTLSGTRLGDCGGNSNITFVAGTSKYWNLAAGGNWNANGWATSSGGGVATTNYPLPQDTAIIENTGLTAGNTITINGAWNIGTLDSSTRTNAMTLASSTFSPTFYGNFTYGSGVTPTGTGTYTFSNRSTKTLNSGGKTFPQNVTIDAPSGGIQLLTNNLTVDTADTTTLTNGTLDLNNLTLSTGLFSSSNSNTRTIAFGTTGSIVTTTTTAGSTVLSMATATNFTFTGTSNISAAMSTTRTFRFGDTAGAIASNRLNINLTSGSSFPTFQTGSTFRQINFTGSTCTPSLASCHGFTLASGGNYIAANFTMVGTGTLTYTGKAINSLNINTAGITTTLADAGQNVTTTLTNGTLNLAGFTLTNTTSAATATGTKNLTFNGGTLVCSAASATAWNNAAPTGFTTTAGTGTGIISMTAATAKTFVGGGSTYNCTLNQGGAGTLTITGANTFSNITNTNATASQITFPASTTTTVNNFTLSGSSGNLVSIRSSTPATQFTLSKSSGTVNASFLDIQDSNATGGAIWNAFTSNGNVDNGNNTGWVFSGGNLYAVSIDENATSADAITLLLIRVGSVSETATGADTTASQLNAVGAISETATGADELTNTASLQLFVAETATGADAFQGNIETTSAVSETATGADTTATALTRVGAVSETATGADAQQGNIETTSAVAETATGADTEAATLTRVGAVDETATGADTTDTQLDAFGGVNETATGADALTTQLDGVATIDETAIAEALAVGNIITTLQISEGATILDESLARLLWELINDNQLPGWQVIQNAQGTGWTVINTNTGTSWTDIDTV